METKDGDITDRDLARETYTAYGASVGFKNFQGNLMPAFDDLPDAIVDAWIAASRHAFGRGWIKARTDV